jgi:phage tail-like protein
MARASTNEPLEKFRFRATFSADGAEVAGVVAGFHDVQLPKRTTNKGTYREGIDNDVNQLFAGLSSMEDVVLSRGLLPSDSSGRNASALYEWMSAVHNPSQSGNRARVLTAGPLDASHAYRKDVTIDMFDREGQVTRTWILKNAWPTNFTPGSDLNAGEDGEKSLEQLTLAYEDFVELKAGTTDAMDSSASLDSVTAP